MSHPTPRTLRNAPMPPPIQRLPRDEHGYPIPWFVACLDDGTYDLRIADHAKRRRATTDRLCWVCGGQLSAYLGFVVGPMCTVNKISADPPSHRDCGRYAALVCPFLATPQMRRRENGLPDGVEEPGGVMLRRNPGVTALWMTKSYKIYRVDEGGVANGGWLYQMGNPTSVEWYTLGRPATGDEVRAAMDAGLPALREVCNSDHDPAASLAALDRQHREALRLVPA